MANDGYRTLLSTRSQLRKRFVAFVELGPTSALCSDWCMSLR